MTFLEAGLLLGSFPRCGVAWLDLFASEGLCCWPVAAATAAALTATFDGLADSTSFSSESDVESESVSDVEAGLILRTNRSSPGGCHFRSKSEIKFRGIFS